MIRSFDFSNTITKKDEVVCKKLIDNLFKSDNWFKNINAPRFQTNPNLHHYKECEIFTSTFIKSCCYYLNENIDVKTIRFWCYMDYKKNSLKKDRNSQWHKHGEIYENKISGIYYLVNPKKSPTEFVNMSFPEVKKYTWYIFPSHLLHRPPEIKNLFNKRYVLSADLSF